MSIVNADINANDNDGRTALFIANQCSNSDTELYLREVKDQNRKRRKNK